MYLKSLVLKGFKSFADRSALTLEPGITAIVGPNGSGKSNISDAVLWVLGERSARNLRGQAMEDIIFAGSAARKAVSVAEVDLVLDNSDHTLPVEFDEVAITRRMYRSGESEYLVNGVVSRRLDVLDILHDTGLGTGTHSIISQGSLDSILQSKPEDRRALIEEAAGVLKHKQRKEKSARKLAQMDNHLNRVRDVTAEVARQLGPLERKAKRAQAHAQASAELAELKLALAVDDLRALQAEWDAVLAAEAEASEGVEARRQTVAAAEQKVNDAQELMRRETEDAGAIARDQRRAASLGERFDGAEMLLRERRRAAYSARADLLAAEEGAQARRDAAEAALAAARAQMRETAAAHAAAEERVAGLEAERAGIDEQHRQAESAVGALADALRSLDEEIERAKREQARLQGDLADGMASARAVESRLAELKDELARAGAEDEAAAAALHQAADALADVQAREARSQEELIARFEERDAAHAVRDDAFKRSHLMQAEIQAIEQAQAASRQDDPALQWAIDNAESFGGLSQASKAFRVPRSLETLVENLLGDDLAALSMRDAGAAERLAAALREGSLAGDVAVVLLEDAAAHRGAPARGAGGRALVDELEYADDMAPVVEALLGDVVVCATRAEAFAAHARSKAPLRFASEDGCVVWPAGKVRMYGAPDPEGEGVIARERRLADLKEALAAVEAELQRAEKAAGIADEAYRTVQVESLKLSQELANCRGAHMSAQADRQRAERRLSAVARESEQAAERLSEAQGAVDEMRPGIAAVEQSIAELGDKRAAVVAQRDARLEEVAPLRARVAALSEEATEAKLAAATLAERKTYGERMVIARQDDVRALDQGDADRRTALTVKGSAIQRADGLLALFGEVSRLLQRRVSLLEEALSAAEGNAGNVHEAASAARDEARRARDDYDAASALMTEVQVRKSRLEVRIEAAVNVVTQDLGTPIDRAQQLPPLEDRRNAEDEAFRLQRRLKSMGNINPDAAEEYAQLKERYDYLAGQLADMEAARKSLGRITRVIDERMKDDFLNTYKQVNNNFNEIFGLLFPGGSAYLSLEDPDDVENTGVEVTAQPRGKRLTKMMLMSGGEKSLTALALLFAVYKTRSTPFYILDEVEAALDDTNLRRLTGYIDTLRSSTQLIMITHQRRTMEMADVLFGVSMQADGVTKVISQKLDRALQDAE